MTTQILPITTLLKNPKWVQDQVQNHGVVFSVVSNSNFAFYVAGQDNLEKISTKKPDTQSRKGKVTTHKNGLKTISYGGPTTYIAINHNDIYDQ
jgi:hypothetical protein